VSPAEGAGPPRNGLIAYTGVTSENAEPEIYAFPLSRGPRVNISRHLDADVYPAVSPDGMKIVFLRRGAGWFVARSDGSEQRPLAGQFPESPGVTGDALRVRWAPDSRHVAGYVAGDVGDPGYQVVVVDTETSATLRVGPGSGPQWSPRSTTVAYTGSATGLYVAALGDRPIRIVAEQVFEFRWSPDGARIAYLSAGGLAVVAVATGATTELAPTVYGSGQIRWSPDGARIYFRSGDETFVFVPSYGGVVQAFAWAGAQGQVEVSPSGTQVALVQVGRLSLRTLDGVVVRKLGKGLNPSWSPDGSQLAFVRDGSQLVAEVATGTVRVLADRKTDTVWQFPGFTEPPVWRPDGTAVIAPSVAGSIRTGLFVTGANGTGTRALPSPHSNEDDPVWSPDGRSIAFTSYGLTPTIMVGDGRLRHVRVIARKGSEPTWSPDGSQVAYVGESKPRAEQPGHVSLFSWSGIFVVGADGRGRHRLTRGKDRSPAWSPDGTTIAFARTTELVGGLDVEPPQPYTYGTNGLYLRRPTGGPARRVFDAGYVGENGENGEVVSISWSPTGSRLAFRLTSFASQKYYSPDEDEVIVIDMRGKVVSRMKAGTSVAWSPDGRFLLHGSNVVDRAITDGHLLTDSHFRITRPDGHPVRGFDLPQRASSPSWQPLCTRSGSSRADRIRGGSGADVLCGLGGNDVITGGDGRDRIFGQGGNDRIDTRDGIFDVIGCGEGRDTVVADGADLVGVDCERVSRP
jgi:Tol biopolymer transport system component